MDAYRRSGRSSGPRGLPSFCRRFRQRSYLRLPDSPNPCPPTSHATSGTQDSLVRQPRHAYHVLTPISDVIPPSRAFQCRNSMWRILGPFSPPVRKYRLPLFGAKQLTGMHWAPSLVAWASSSLSLCGYSAGNLWNRRVMATPGNHQAYQVATSIQRRVAGIFGDRSTSPRVPPERWGRWLGVVG